MEERKLKPRWSEGKSCDWAWKSSELVGHLCLSGCPEMSGMCTSTAISYCTWAAQEGHVLGWGISLQLRQTLMELDSQRLSADSWTMGLLCYWWSIWVALPWIHPDFLSRTPIPVFCLEHTTSSQGHWPPKSHAVHASGLKFTISWKKAIFYTTSWYSSSWSINKLKEQVLLTSGFLRIEAQ